MTFRRLMLSVVLLPLFIARSMLPSGLMLSFDAAGPRLVPCPGIIAVPHNLGHERHQAHPGPQGHEQHSYGENQSGAKHEQQLCLFAFAAAAPLMQYAHAILESSVFEEIAALPATAISVSTSRAHPIRAPPALS